MNTQALFLDPNQESLSLPAQARTRSGVVFDPRQDLWQFRDGVKNVSLAFDGLGIENSELKDALKSALLWQIRNMSPSHAINMHVKIKHLFKFLMDQFSGLPAEISEEHLISYGADPMVLKNGYLSGLSGFLKKWHELGYPGVSKGAVDYLKSVRLSGNEKGVAVRTMDPVWGPLTVMETEALLDALSDAFRDQKVSTQDYLLAWLVIAIGMRPIQYATLKVCDLKVLQTQGGDETFMLSIPRAKQQGVVDMRSVKKDRAILPEVGKLMRLHIQEVKSRLSGLLSNLEQAPMFPARLSQRAAPGYEFHNDSTSLARMAKQVLDALNVRSHRTGEQIHIAATRFRRTIGTRAAEEGHGPLVIAEILDHTDTQNVGVYTEATPAIIERIDRAIAMQMAPLAQAFAGKLIKSEAEATRGNDPSSRIIDLRIDRSGQAMGSCGQYSHCSFSAPIACYRCSCFEPWLDGPHETVLAYLLDRREKLLATTDERMASVNDLTILAVAEVVRRCDEVKVSKLGNANV
tara:strand:- start:2630 stop:4186 length:1557 start_codon:yes stop_codon:yes gene_type:complete